MHIYDKYLNLVKGTASAKTELNPAIKDLNIPELYIYDQRYTVLFLIAEISVREKGHFISNDLKQETNLSDKSVERFINFLVKKGFYTSKQVGIKEGSFIILLRTYISTLCPLGQ